jgi:hypothetical protein
LDCRRQLRDLLRFVVKGFADFVMFSRAKRISTYDAIYLAASGGNLSKDVMSQYEGNLTCWQMPSKQNKNQ